MSFVDAMFCVRATQLHSGQLPNFTVAVVPTKRLQRTLCVLPDCACGLERLVTATGDPTDPVLAGTFRFRGELCDCSVVMV